MDDLPALLVNRLDQVQYPHASDPLLRRDRVDAARARLDQQAWELAWAEGRAMTTEQAIAEALGAPTAQKTPEA